MDGLDRYLPPRRRETLNARGGRRVSRHENENSGSVGRHKSAKYADLHDAEFTNADLSFSPLWLRL